MTEIVKVCVVLLYLIKENNISKLNTEAFYYLIDGIVKPAIPTILFFAIGPQ